MGQQLSEFNKVDLLLMKQLKEGSEEALKSLVERYYQKTFVFVSCFVGWDANKAYDITVSAFVESVRRMRSTRSNKSFLVPLIQIVLKQIKDLPTIAHEVQGFSDSSNVKIKSIRFVTTALTKLPIERKTALLLRDQFNCTLDDISSIVGIPVPELKALIVQYRAHFRQSVADVLEDSKGVK